MALLKNILPQAQYNETEEEEDETLSRAGNDYEGDYPIYTHRDKMLENKLVSQKHSKNKSKLKSTRCSLQHDLEDYKEQMRNLKPKRKTRSNKPKQAKSSSISSDN